MTIKDFFELRRGCYDGDEDIAVILTDGPEMALWVSFDGDEYKINDRGDGYECDADMDVDRYTAEWKRCVGWED